MPKKRKINGEGTVYKYKSGYRGQIVIGTDDNGKPIRKSVSGKTAKEVTIKLTEIKNSLITGMYVAPDETTVCNLAQTLLDEDLALNYIKEGTYHRNKETLKRLQKNPILNNTPIQSLTYVQLQQFLLGETCMSQSIINKVYNMLGRTFKEAVKRKIIVENPMADVKKPNSKKVNIKVRALTRVEEQKLYNVIVHNDVPYAHQMLLSMFTGMRMGEVNALTKNDIDLDAGTITIDKTISRDTKGTAFVSDTTKTEAGTRTIPISSTVLPIVKEILQLCENEEYLFMKNGKNINTSQVNMQFSRIIKKYNIPDPKIKGKITLHSLRHTYATRCIEAGMQPKVLQKLLGHTDIKITMNTYCDAFESYQNENVAKVDDYFSQMGFDYENVNIKAE